MKSTAHPIVRALAALSCAIICTVTLLGCSGPKEADLKKMVIDDLNTSLEQIQHLSDADIQAEINALPDLKSLVDEGIDLVPFMKKYLSSFTYSFNENEIVVDKDSITVPIYPRAKSISDWTVRFTQLLSEKASQVDLSAITETDYKQLITDAINEAIDKTTIVDLDSFPITYHKTKDGNWEADASIEDLMARAVENS